MIEWQRGPDLCPMPFPSTLAHAQINWEDWLLYVLRICHCGSDASLGKNPPFFLIISPLARPRSHQRLLADPAIGIDGSCLVVQGYAFI